MDWLRIPVAVLDAYSQMLPRLEARGSLDRVAEVAVGSGTMGKADRKSIVHEWEREARGPQPVQHLDEESKRAQLASIGITVEEQ
jgi:hypothetical protein